MKQIETLRKRQYDPNVLDYLLGKTSEVKDTTSGNIQGIIQELLKELELDHPIIIKALKLLSPDYYPSFLYPKLNTRKALIEFLEEKLEVKGVQLLLALSYGNIPFSFFEETCKTLYSQDKDLLKKAFLDVANHYIFIPYIQAMISIDEAYYKSFIIENIQPKINDYQFNLHSTISLFSDEESKKKITNEALTYWFNRKDISQNYLSIALDYLQDNANFKETKKSIHYQPLKHESMRFSQMFIPDSICEFSSTMIKIIHLSTILDKDESIKKLFSNSQNFYQDLQMLSNQTDLTQDTILQAMTKKDDLTKEAYQSLLENAPNTILASLAKSTAGSYKHILAHLFSIDPSLGYDFSLTILPKASAKGTQKAISKHLHGLTLENRDIKADFIKQSTHSKQFVREMALDYLFSVYEEGDADFFETYAKQEKKRDLKKQVRERLAKKMGK